MRDVTKLPTGLALYSAKAGGFVMYGGGTYRRDTATVWYYTHTGKPGDAPVLGPQLSSLAAFWDLVA